jgi:hypothetical protein
VKKQLLLLLTFFLSMIAFADQIPVTLTGYEFSSDEPRANRLAMQSYTAACKDLKDQARLLSGNRLAKFSCGTPIAIVDDDGELSYSSIATLSFRGDSTQVLSTGVIAGDEVQWTEESADEPDSARKEARASYDSNCEDWRAEMEIRFGDDLLYADCGEKENSPAKDLPEGSLAWKYVSHGRVTLAPDEKTPKPQAQPKPIVVRAADNADPEALLKTRDELRERLRALQEKLKVVPKAVEPSPLPSGPVIGPPPQPAL